MATFTQLQTRLRDDILTEDSTAFFSDADLLGFLTEANAEISSLGRLVEIAATQAVASGSVNINISATPSIGDVVSVVWGDYPLERIDFNDHYFYKSQTGIPRYFLFDKKRNPGSATQTVSISPKASSSGTATIIYNPSLSTDTYSGSDSPFEGRFSDWHDAVLYLAAVKAFERSQEYDMAQYWNQRLEKRLQMLAIFLDDDSVLGVTDRNFGGEA